MDGTRSTHGLLRTGILVVFLFFAVSGWGQVMNANITGGGGTSKYTFDIRVDGMADVQIRGNQGYLQTRSGMQATWRRLQCNQPLPRNPYNLRFKGIDGRGKQYLLKDPNSNNGVAVIRIEDPRNGTEGYTGDILWDGGNNNGGNWNGGWWNDNWNGGGGWDNGGNGGGNNGGNWNGVGGNNGQWSNNLVPHCQNNVRNKVRSQTGGANVSFNGNPSRKQAASFVMVDGNGNARGSNGRQGNFTYHCTMHPNGNVADSNYNWTSGNFNPPPQPR
ncbi:MAG TPA: hypothetical protein VIH91_08915 [Terriglobales bacterium]